MNKPAIIALLTDFGTRDAYVGTMKGVMLGICPQVQLIDLTHAIAPQDVRQAAYVLLTAYRHFPAHTVFLVVVDPGVGTPRRPIALQTDHGTYVAPDNGVLSYVLARVTVQQAVELTAAEYRHTATSQTFHGRDIFSPAAAHLANGTPISVLGPAIMDWATLPEPALIVRENTITGEVLYIDHFGNIITSIGNLQWAAANRLHFAPEFGSAHPPDIPPLDAAGCRATLAGRTLTPVRRAYGEVPPGSLLALIGSSEQLEIGQNQGNAARTLQVKIGDPVTLATSTPLASRGE